jgi:flagellar hook-associated protein 3 FlgL
MRVASHSVSESIVRQIQQLGSQQARLQNQVANGQRIFQPEDDPSAMGRVLNLETEARHVAQYTRNADRALELSQTTFSGLQGLKKISDRGTEVGTLGVGVVSPDALHAYSAEIGQLIEQALQVANSKLGNDYLYAGTAVDSPPFVATRDASGKVTSVAYAGNGDRASMPLSSASEISVNTSGETNFGIRDLINQLVALRDGLVAGDQNSISTAQNGLLAAENELVSALGEHGGIQTRIEASMDQHADLAISLESLISKETDADMPATIVKLTQTQTAYQAALQSAANIMRISLLDYIN